MWKVAVTLVVLLLVGILLPIVLVMTDKKR